MVNHNEGNTFQKILQILKECDYWVKYKILNAYTHGNIPQNRARVFIVGFRKKEQYDNFYFP